MSWIKSERFKLLVKSKTTAKVVTIMMIALFFVLVIIQVFFIEHGVPKKVWMTQAQIALIEVALSEFYLDHGRFPSQEEGLEIFLVKPEDMAESWDGPYLKKGEMIDFWRNRIVYRNPSTREGEDYDLISYGKDGKPGGKGLDKDILN